MKTLFSILLASLTLCVARGQAPGWERTYKSQGSSAGRSICLSPNGKLLAAGWTHSISPLESDALLVSISAGGEPDWEYEWGEPVQQEKGVAAAYAQDGRLVFAVNEDSASVLAVLDPKRRLQWQQRQYFAGVRSRSLSLAVGSEQMVWGGNAGSRSWMQSLDLNGRLRWQWQWDSCELHTVLCLPDGRVAVAGSARGDAWITLLDQNGQKLWETASGGRGLDAFYALLLTPEGDLLAAGETDFMGSGRPSGFLQLLDSTGREIRSEVVGEPEVPAQIFGLAACAEGFVAGGLHGDSALLQRFDWRLRAKTRCVFSPLTEARGGAVTGLTIAGDNIFATGVATDPGSDVQYMFVSRKSLQELIR